jgi:hypothetical protein
MDTFCFYLDDITGTLGIWLEAETYGVPNEVIALLQKAYDIAVKELDK